MKIADFRKTSIHTGISDKSESCLSKILSPEYYGTLSRIMKVTPSFFNARIIIKNYEL